MIRNATGGGQIVIPAQSEELQVSSSTSEREISFQMNGTENTSTLNTKLNVISIKYNGEIKNFSLQDLEALWIQNEFLSNAQWRIESLCRESPFSLAEAKNLLLAFKFSQDDHSHNVLTLDGKRGRFKLVDAHLNRQFSPGYFFRQLWGESDFYRIECAYVVLTDKVSYLKQLQSETNVEEDNDFDNSERSFTANEAINYINHMKKWLQSFIEKAITALKAPTIDKHSVRTQTSVNNERPDVAMEINDSQQSGDGELERINNLLGFVPPWVENFYK